MIRPLTIVTFLLAFGSGLYLYQSKHEVQVLDRKIERTLRDTSTLREQSRLLAAEWTMLNDPERLRQFSDTYLSVKSIAPSQFTSLADLGGRLPAPRAEIPSNGMDEQEALPVAGETGFEPVPEPASVAILDEVLPIPPIPAMPPAPVVASVAHPADARAQDRRPMVADNQAHPGAVADGRPSDQHSAEQHVAARGADARTSVAAPPRPVVLAAPQPWPANAPTGTPVNAPPASTPSSPAMATASGPYAGSLLGMARGSMPPAPRPTPVNATYNSN